MAGMKPLKRRSGNQYMHMETEHYRLRTIPSLLVLTDRNRAVPPVNIVEIDPGRRSGVLQLT